MIYFNSDYLEGAHPALMAKLNETNMVQTVGYGEDEYCAAAREKIKAVCQAPEADVHFLVGGTQTNTTVIASILRPWQGVLSADSGHINCHEAGAIESTGHKVITLPAENGKITAKQVADYLHADHTEVIINKQIVLDALEDVIAMLGTWDITTIRASVGMYLVCKYIHEHTDIRVLLTGEISDELFGYKYTDFAPSAAAFQAESQKRIRELYMYDVLRADRSISVNSLEARVPFGDLDFVKYVMAIDPAKKLNTYGKGKYLLRKAFEGDWLPEEILWREKAAFSDAVGHSMVDDLKEYAEEQYTDRAFAERAGKYAYARPFTKESLLYREIFEKYYPGQAEMIVDYWMPNKAWPGCDVNDPSARVLSNYGASGR